LIVPIHEERAIKTKKIDVTGCDVKTLERNGIAAYLYGYDRIEFSSKIMLAEQKQLIRKACYKLIGPEIIEEAQTPWLSRPSLTQMSFLSKRSTQDVSYCWIHAKGCSKTLKTLDYDLALDVIQRDDETDRLYPLISKQFRSILCGGRMSDSAGTNIEE
jgi:phosphate uptake regulator